jgi:hypothetical protein
MRRTAPPSRPYGRYAVGLRPSLDPDAYFDAPNQDQEAPKQAKANTAVVLTGPAPSGMTCMFLAYSVVELPGIEPVAEMPLTSGNAGFNDAKQRQTTRNDLRLRDRR